LRLVLAIAGLAGATLAGAAAAQSVTTGDAAPAIPVVVELYTSEGCSDCPPADRVLTDLLDEQPVAGVQVIALGEHVDYWDYLGWKDRFSSAAFTDRQKTYQTAVFAPTPVYTPQVVVDGRLQCVGSDREAVRHAVERAAKAAKVDVRLTATVPETGRSSITIDVALPDTVVLERPADILVAVVEDGLVTEVARGENRGRTLGHNAVVRALEAVAEVPPHESAVSATTRISMADAWDPERLRIVAFVQERDSRRILGAASTEFDGDHAP
jgi:hypothetical protein